MIMKLSICSMHIYATYWMSVNFYIETLSNTAWLETIYFWLVTYLLWFAKFQLFWGYSFEFLYIFTLIASRFNILHNAARSFGTGVLFSIKNSGRSMSHTSDWNVLLQNHVLECFWLNIPKFGDL